MTTPRSPGVISRNEAYGVAEFRSRVRMKDFAWRQVVKDGLRVIAVGRRHFVRGEDWFAFLERKAASATEADNHEN